MVKQTLKAEWVRLRSRRELIAILLFVPVLVALQYSGSVSSLIAQSQTAPGTVLPPEVVRFNEMALARYQAPQSIPAVLGAALPILTAAVVLLTCLSVGTEFGAATVRTGVIFSASRFRYACGRFVGAVSLALTALILVVSTAAILPWAAGLLGVTLGQAEPLTLPGATLVVVTFAFVATAATAASFALTLLTRSSVLGAVAFGALVAVDASFRQLGSGSALLPFWPGQAIEDVVRGALSAAGAVLTPTPIGSTDAVSDPVRAAAALLAWGAALLIGGLAGFINRDITE